MIIRNATIDDTINLASLLKQLGYLLDIETMKARIAAFQPPNNHILIAEQDGFIMGAISFGLYEQLWINGPCCRIDTLIVDKSSRGQGIGKRLVKRMEDFAKERGCRTIELITANRRKGEGTHVFYESLSYKDHHHFDFTYFCKEQVTQ